MNRILSLIVLGFATLSLAACSDLRDDLGLGRSSPDEFAVVDRPPLSVPPDFSLRPPMPGAPRPQEVDMTKHANDILFGDDGTPTDAAKNFSNGERMLLMSSNAGKADPTIREVVDREAAQKVVGTKHLVDDLLWWRKDPVAGTTVDATAEAARIKNAKAKGLPINQGATPVIERQKSGWLGL